MLVYGMVYFIKMKQIINKTPNNPPKIYGKFFLKGNFELIPISNNLLVKVTTLCRFSITQTKRKY